jgi:hypothetical protein
MTFTDSGFRLPSFSTCSLLDESLGCMMMMIDDDDDDVFVVDEIEFVRAKKCRKIRFQTRLKIAGK